MEAGHISAPQTVEHSAYVDVLSNLLPPCRADDHPAQEFGADTLAVRAQQNEILPQRELALVTGGPASLPVSGLILGRAS